MIAFSRKIARNFFHLKSWLPVISPKGALSVENCNSGSYECAVLRVVD
jgi:hypothetical protein